MTIATSSRCGYVRSLFHLAEVPAGPGWRTASFLQTAGQVRQLALPGRLILIQGPSGSGKSLLLAELGQSLALRAVACDAIHLPDIPAIDCLHQLEIEAALELLCRVGLGEAHCYLATPSQLSTGQRFRLKLAMALAQLRRHTRDTGVLLCDEFATQLDRISAMVIARTLARATRQEGSVCVVIASCHDDLEKALDPDVVVTCDFGQFTLTQKGMR